MGTGLSKLPVAVHFPASNAPSGTIRVQWSLLIVLVERPAALSLQPFGSGESEEEGAAPVFCSRSVRATNMITTLQLEQALQQQLEGTAHFLVSAEVHPGGKAVVEVDGEEAPVTLAVLSTINQALREAFGTALDDVELQVGSPGVGRPFKVERQYRKHLGHEVEVALLDGGNLLGLLEAYAPDALTLRILEPAKVKGRKPKLSEATTVIPFTGIKSTQATIKLN